MVILMVNYCLNLICIMQIQLMQVNIVPYMYMYIRIKNVYFKKSSIDLLYRSCRGIQSVICISGTTGERIVNTIIITKQMLGLSLHEHLFRQFTEQSYQDIHVHVIILIIIIIIIQLMERGSVQIILFILLFYTNFIMNMFQMCFLER